MDPPHPQLGPCPCPAPGPCPGWLVGFAEVWASSLKWLPHTHASRPHHARHACGARTASIRYSCPAQAHAHALCFAGKALFAYLQPSIKSICQNVYPDNPDAVDPRLTENIFRDSEDPGAVNVLTSGAKLPPPRTKNELFEDFGGPVLVVQGLNDPLGAGTARTRFVHAGIGTYVGCAQFLWFV